MDWYPINVRLGWAVRMTVVFSIVIASHALIFGVFFPGAEYWSAIGWWSLILLAILVEWARVHW